MQCVIHYVKTIFIHAISESLAQTKPCCGTQSYNRSIRDAGVTIRWRPCSIFQTTQRRSYHVTCIQSYFTAFRLHTSGQQSTVDEIQTCPRIAVCLLHASSLILSHLSRHLWWGHVPHTWSHQRWRPSFFSCSLTAYRRTYYVTRSRHM